jgi:hypothetical protein
MWIVVRDIVFFRAALSPLGNDVASAYDLGVRTFGK